MARSCNIEGFLDSRHYAVLATVSVVIPRQKDDSYVLLTRPPLYSGRRTFSLDLHVLGPPLTFVLSQDQTLMFKPWPVLEFGVLTCVRN